MFAALGAVRIVYGIDRSQGWISPLSSETASGVLATIASAQFTFVVFVSSSLLVAVQLASAALTPRIIALVFRDPVTRLSLAFFVFSFIFTLASLVRIETPAPLLTTHLAGYGCVASLGIFLYLIDHLGKTLRPSGALRAVAHLTREVIDSVYPQRLVIDSERTLPDLETITGKQPTATIMSLGDGAVLAFDQAGLLALATRDNCLIEMVPQVGDHISQGDPLFRIFSQGASPPIRTLLGSVAIGQERTVQQDPTFGFRILVDIASKALSPAINDPTTAVLALDQIHNLLRRVGNRRLDTGLIRDRAGPLRLIYRTPDWDDFVRLAFTEIRLFGGESIQVARRLRAMLENLIQTMPASRIELLQRELALLIRSCERLFIEPEDRALAEISDYQGVGGKQEKEKLTEMTHQR
jgi:uncharacterized membrane protein